ncbi:MAG: hypothetical protein ABWX71_02520 [Aeromicrobium sp.]
MTVFITPEELASYPGVGLAPDQVPGIVIDLINEFVDEIVVETVGIAELEPVPARIRAIALEAAARSIRYSAGASSISTAIDDWKKTVRFEGEEFKAGIYLTDEEEDKIRAVLLGKESRPTVGSIRLHVPGYGRGPAH